MKSEAGKVKLSLFKCCWVLFRKDEDNVEGKVRRKVKKKKEDWPGKPREEGVERIFNKNLLPKII